MGMRDSSPDSYKRMPDDIQGPGDFSQTVKEQVDVIF